MTYNLFITKCFGACYLECVSGRALAARAIISALLAFSDFSTCSCFSSNAESSTFVLPFRLLHRKVGPLKAFA